MNVQAVAAVVPTAFTCVCPQFHFVTAVKDKRSAFGVDRFA